MDFRVVTVVVLVLALGGFLASRLTTLRTPVLSTAGAAEAHSNEDYPAPNFQGVTAWINSPPLSVTDLRGKVVLVDFWTYSCINCIRTLPFLKSFDAQYRPFGLDIVGVHSPEFSFEKVQSNVQAAVMERGVVWPVAMDNDLKTWTAYKNQYWPHVYLVDRQGNVRYDFIGEGQDAAMQAAIRTLLAEPGVTLPRAAPLPVSGPSQTQLTPEIYLGPQRGQVQGSLANAEGYRSGAFDYPPPDPGRIQQAGPGGQFFLSGPWRAAGEDIQPGAAGAQVILPFYARDVYIVGGPAASGAATLSVMLDGQPVPVALSGQDVHDGVVTLDHRDLYHLVHLGGVQYHVLTLSTRDANGELFTFTFG